MRADLLKSLDVRLVRIGEGDAQGLEVEPLLVAHLEPADRPRPDVAAGEGRLVDDEECVRVVAVVGARPLDETVVEVVEDGGREDPVEAEDARLLVELVLVPAASRDLDDDLDDVRETTRQRHPVSVVVEAFFDELLLDRPPVRVEAGELEVLLELEVHVVLAAPVLLDRHDDPVAEALRLVRVELDVDLGDDVVLLVEDEDDVGLVVDRRAAAQVEVAQARP
jgi:hypothetical protein